MSRLPLSAIDYIKSTDESYSKIIANVEKICNRKISKGLVSHYKGKRSGRIKPFHRENVDQVEWDWLIGLYYSDGCKYKSRGRYIVVFALSKNEQGVLNKLLDILTKMGLKTGILLKNNTVCARIFSKQFYLALPSKEEPYQPRSALAYLAGLMDGDGYMQKERWVFSQAKYPHLIKQVCDIGVKYGHLTVVVQKPSNDRKIPIYRVSFLRDARENLLRSDFAKYSIKCLSLGNGPAGEI